MKILQNSQENTRAKVSFSVKTAGLMPATLLKKILWHRYFSVDFAKCLRTSFLENTSRRLLLYLKTKCFQLSMCNISDRLLIDSLLTSYNTEEVNLYLKWINLRENKTFALYKNLFSQINLFEFICVY